MMRISVMLYIASAVGLLYSGYVTDNLDWRLIFLPKIVFVVAAVWLLCRYFPNMPAPTNPRAAGTDKAGIVFLGLSLACLQIVLSRGEIDDWFGSSQIQSLTWISLIAMILFIGWQFHPRNKVRLLAVDLFGHRNVLASVILGVLTGIILSGSIFALPEFLRHVDPRELNATDTGRILCAYAFTAAAIRPLVTRAIPKFGQRKVLTFSLVMLIASMLIFARLITLGTPEVYYIAPLILYAFCLVPLLGAVGSGTAARMPQDQQLDAVSIYMTFRQFGTALGVTLISVLLDRREEFHSSRLFEHLHATGSQVYAWVGTATHAISYRAGVPTIQAHEMAMKLLGDEGARQAATLAYADSFLFMAGIGVLALCCVPLMSPTPVVTK
jgi:MFS family permease